MLRETKSMRLVVISSARLDSSLQQAFRDAATVCAFSIAFVRDPSELSNIDGAGTNTVFLSVIPNLEEVRNQLSLIQSCKSAIKARNAFMIALNHTGHRTVHTILRKMGFSEVISVSALLPSASKPRLIAALMESASLFQRGKSQRGAGESQRSSPKDISLKIVEPLEITPNCWLLRSSEDIRIVHGQWLIDLFGPAATTGNWVVRRGSQVDAADGHSVWEWQPKPSIPESLQTARQGTWVFWGQRPRFVDYHWTFISKAPRLAFIDTGGDCLGEYFSLLKDQSSFNVSANSILAMRKWADICSTVLGPMRIARTAEKIKELRTRFTDAFGKPLDGADTWRGVVGVSEQEERTHYERMAEVYDRLRLKLAPNSNVFSKIEDLSIRQKYLSELRANKKPVLVWTQGQAIKFEAQVLDFIEHPERFVLLPPGDVPRESLQGKIFVNITFPRGLLFFSVTGHSLEWKEQRLLLSAPAEVFEVQRRQGFRYYIPADHGMYARASDRVFRILNISSGGLAISMSPADAARISDGELISGLSFNLAPKLFQCDAEVRWSKPVQGVAGREPEYHAGVCFKDLAPEARQYIELYVLEASFEYLNTYVL